MAIKGSFKEISLPDVLQLLSVGHKTGCLKVTDGKSFGSIFFKDGKICYSSLLNRPDRLGDRLLSRGFITNSQLGEALKHQQTDPDGRRLGDILIHLGLLTKQDLESDVSRQIADAIFYLLRWDEGDFFFEPDTLPTEEAITVSLDVLNLLLEEARRIDEWKNLEAKLPGVQIVLERLILEGSQQVEMELNEEERQVIQLIDGRRTMGEVMVASSLGEFLTSKIIYGLLRAGLVKRGNERGRAAARAGMGAIDEHRNLGIAFYKTQMYEEAYREYRRIVEIKPDEADARFYLGLINFRKAEYAEAATEFLEAIAIEPKKACSYNNLGLALEAMGEYEDASRQYKKALEMASDKVIPKLNLAHLACRKKEWGLAQEQLKKIEEQSGKTKLGSFLLGLAAYRSSQWDQAIEHWQECSQGGRFNPASENNIAAIWQARGQVEESERHYQAALKVSPENRMLLHNLSELYYRHSLWPQAVDVLTRVADLGLADVQQLYKLGNLCLKQGQKDNAVKWWKKALELDPSNQMIRRNLDLAEKG
ncbi:tetratricopeptide repeat protein [candidate division TA06 bacterium]|uniref:Tetratricopeptide repeat protein n=1 Tax=candidate division TA06 bacterium TaxID=2250710 RepID=A0A933MIQ8_UNCT6|nr:tetratricopeptide repeat protein [candidate division TA06 bacterium]